MSESSSKHAWVTAVVPCRDLIEAKDGSASLINTFDRMTVNVPSVPIAEKVATQIIVFISVRGDKAGKHTCSIKFTAPDGSTSGRSSEIDFEIEGPQRGMNLVTRLQLPLHGEGLYWLDVLLDGESNIRFPLQVQIVYDQLQQPKEPAQKAPPAKDPPQRSE